MNIRDHIEAGHYERDEKGRALVPTFEGATATVVCVDKPGTRPLLGWVPTQSVVGALGLAWTVDGRTYDTQGCDLLPPPPRKVKVTGWALYKGDQFWTWYATEVRARKCCRPDEHVVELTGEYEEPWS